jgi:hypothetical protein
VIIFYLRILLFEMNHKEQLSLKIAALLLVIALMSPALVKLLHICQDHEHIACNDQSSHIHKTTIKCDTCSFHLASFSNDLMYFPALVVPCVKLKLIVNFAPQEYSFFNKTNTRLRAPPVFS